MSDNAKDKMLAGMRKRSELDQLRQKAAQRETAEIGKAIWIPRDQIIVDPRIQCRVRGLNPETVESYRLAMLEGGWGEFPPVILFRDGDKFYLSAGFHRHEAAGQADLTEDLAEVRPGGWSAAYWFALTDNLANGLQLGREDKKEILKRMMGMGDEPLPEGEPVPSARSLANTLGVSHSTVAAWIAELQEVTGQNRPVGPTVGADGRVYNTGKIVDANKRDGFRGNRSQQSTGGNPPVAPQPRYVNDADDDSGWTDDVPFVEYDADGELADLPPARPARPVHQPPAADPRLGLPGLPDDYDGDKEGAIQLRAQLRSATLAARVAMQRFLEINGIRSFYVFSETELAQIDADIWKLLKEAEKVITRSTDLREKIAIMHQTGRPYDEVDDGQQ